MARVVVPIIRLRYADGDAFALDLAEIFDEEGASVSDEFTYTMRVSADGHQRHRIVDKIRARLPEGQAERVLELLEQNQWDISFFVDAY